MSRDLFVEAPHAQIVDEGVELG
ncbi:MAG: hypothetical protein QOE57_2852, partial [Acidimicrobiaceae bacterium]|nr:hypothetical protein [Acidimicrobiaceae bacterium]